MKRLFYKSPKSSSSKPPVPVHNDLIAHTPALQPKFVVPPVPHPRPHDHIAILPTEEGLFLRPHGTRPDDSDNHIRISWGKSPKFEELRGSAQNVGSWSSAVIVYGIVGILELFTGSFSSRFLLQFFIINLAESYLLVITSRLEVGHSELSRSCPLNAVFSLAQCSTKAVKSMPSKMSQPYHWVVSNRLNLQLTPLRAERPQGPVGPLSLAPPESNSVIPGFLSTKQGPMSNFQMTTRSR